MNRRKRAKAGDTIAELVNEMHSLNIDYRRCGLPCGCKLLVIVTDDARADELHRAIVPILEREGTRMH